MIQKRRMNRNCSFRISVLYTLRWMRTGKFEVWNSIRLHNIIKKQLTNLIQAHAGKHRNKNSPGSFQLFIVVNILKLF